MTLVDVIPLTWDNSTVTGFEYSTDGTNWTQAGGAGWIKPGTQVKAIVASSVNSGVGETALYQVRAKGQEPSYLTQVTGAQLTAASNKPVVTGMTTDMIDTDGFVRLTATRVYTVRLNGSETLGNFAAGDDVAISSLEKNDVVIVRNKYNGSTNDKLQYAAYAVNQSDWNSLRFAVSEDVQHDDPYITLPAAGNGLFTAIYGTITDDLYIDLYEAVKVDFANTAAFTEVIFNYNGSKSSDWNSVCTSANSGWYVPADTKVEIKMTAGTIVTSTTDDGDTVTQHNAPTATSASVTVGSDDITIGTATVTSVYLTVVKTDGTDITNNAVPVASGVAVRSGNTSFIDWNDGKSYTTTVEEIGDSYDPNILNGHRYTITISGVKAAAGKVFVASTDVGAVTLLKKDNSTDLGWDILSASVTPGADGTTATVVVDVLVKGLTT